MNNSKAGIKYILEGMNSRLSNRYECISNLENNILITSQSSKKGKKNF